MLKLIKMTNGEINLEVAVKALEKGMLKGSDRMFIESIKDFNKYQLKKLTGKQYKFLVSICRKYNDYV
jgi:hypothetical protein